MTDRYGVIGHPISHSRSPIIHQLFALQTGQDISYEAFDIRPEELDACLRVLLGGGIRGFNVTVPHKEAIARRVHALTDRAHLAGAVNTVTVRTGGHLEGDNTDGVGLVTDLTLNLGITLRGASVLVLGAGGATRGIVPALLGAGVRHLIIANRTVERARDLAAGFERLGPVTGAGFDQPGTEASDLVINATSAGLHGELPPFPAGIIAPGTIGYDLSYAMGDTPFCAWARICGAGAVYQGWGMLVEQAAEAFRIWRGVRPDTAAVRAKLP